LNEAAPGVLSNDGDVDSTGSLATTAGRVTSSLGATVDIGPNGNFLYDPTTSQTLRKLNQGESVNDTFLYVAKDPQGAMTTGTVVVTVSGISDPPYQNQVNNYDVNGDGFVSPIDALILINYINTNGMGPLPLPPLPVPPYLDPDGDGSILPIDVLGTIQAINDQTTSAGAAEGEAAVAEASRTEPEATVFGVQILAMPVVDLAAAPALTAAWAGPATFVGPSSAAPARSGTAPSRTAEQASESGWPAAVEAMEDTDLEDLLAEIAGDIGDANRSANAVDEVFSELFG
jgi:VCBS repeat-containing protein